MTNHRVVVTGMGQISSLGHDVAHFREALVAGRVGIGPIEGMDAGRLSLRNVAEVKGFDAQEMLEGRQVQWLDRFAQFALVAALEAVRDAGVEWTDALRERSAVVTGSAAGGQQAYEEGSILLFERNRNRVHPLSVPRIMMNAGASQVATEFGVVGPTYTVSTACAASNHAIGQAFWMVRQGLVDLAIAGGSEAPFSLGYLKAWEAAQAVDPQPCRPFSADRKGTTLGEGAAMLVLEPLDRAVERGATIYGEIVGFGMSADASHVTQPSGAGAVRAMRAAIQDAGIDPSRVDYVNAHGTGTPLNDKVEAAAIHEVFGERARSLPVSSTKSMHGHTQGAAGALEAVATLLALRDGVLPPTASFSGPDPEIMRAARPDVSAMSDRELVDRAVELIETWFRKLFAQHIFVTYAATVPTGIIGGVTQAVGRPELALKLMAGLGGVDSAAPSWAMWDLGRMVAGSPALMALFDAGADGLLDRLRASDDGDAAELVAAFDRFLYEFGSRGPNEWEMRSPTWETRPGLALAAVDRMRLSPASASPQGHQDALAADREAVSAEIAALVEGDPETHGQLLAAIRAASIFLPGRERSKTNIIRLVHESRWCMREVGRRMVERGHFDDVEDFGFVRKDELDRLVDDPASLVDDVRARKAWYAELAEREPPFITVGQPPPASAWPLRRDAHVERAVSGDVLPGLPGCPGTSTGTARVLLSPDDPTALNPGDVLVAPITDPSWTPLFVGAAGVVVDTGAQLSHAIIVSRELGIPCVVSVTGATQRIQDGATVTVDGTSGTVTVH